MVGWDTSLRFRFLFLLARVLALWHPPPNSFAILIISFGPPFDSLHALRWRAVEGMDCTERHVPFQSRIGYALVAFVIAAHVAPNLSHVHTTGIGISVGGGLDGVILGRAPCLGPVLATAPVSPSSWGSRLGSSPAPFPRTRG